MGVLGSETACKGWIYHADILLQPILSLYLSLSVSLSLSHALQLFTALPYWVFLWLLHQVAEHKYALFIGLFPQKATNVSVRDYHKHTNVLLTRTNCWQALSLLCATQGGARKWKVRPINFYLHLKQQRHGPNPAVCTNNTDASKEELP